uniref:Transposon protein, putative, unclassified n=2 Tax=Oryza sativa subsp. japonica TaxID=39947 RepID=Q8H039_ORYSJ|nr:Unknown protein [Oryza sativa Japonica Group]ABF93940.1 transposon protein, putative, unclassified [Oryza sativa Japonica Group]
MTMADGAGRDRSGLGPGKRKERVRPESTSRVLARAGSSDTCDDGEQGRARQWRGRKRGRLVWGGARVYRAAMSVWEGGTDIGRSSQRAGSPTSGQNDDREDDAGGGKKKKRKRERRLDSCHFGKRRKEGEGDEAVGGGALPPTLGSMRGGGGAGS